MAVYRNPFSVYTVIQKKTKTPPFLYFPINFSALGYINLGHISSVTCRKAAAHKHFSFLSAGLVVSPYSERKYLLAFMANKNDTIKFLALLQVSVEAIGKSIA